MIDRLTGGLADVAAYLPGFSVLDIRRIDHDVDKQVILGAGIGFIIGTLALAPAPFLAAAARRHVGYWWGHVVLIGYKIAVVYLMLLLIAHWSQVDDSDSQ